MNIKGENISDLKELVEFCQNFDRLLNNDMPMK